MEDKMGVKNSSEKFRIQVMSDIHLEMIHYELPVITPQAPHLALLGDIGVMKDKNYEKYKQFLLAQSKQFNTVIVLMGNHGILAILIK